MSVQKINPRILVITFFILVVAVFRIFINMNGPVFPLANFSPVGAMALFGGTYFKSRAKSYLFPLLILLVSDFILSLMLSRHYENGFLYSGWYWVYAAFAGMVLAARLIINSVRFGMVLIAIFTVTFIHWIVSDMGVWLQGTSYAKTAAGFWTCLAAAIPFERNFLAGTLLYSGIMFIGFEWLQRKFSLLAPAN
jgi:hypothetical protein